MRSLLAAAAASALVATAPAIAQDWARRACAETVPAAAPAGPFRAHPAIAAAQAAFLAGNLPGAERALREALDGDAPARAAALGMTAQIRELRGFADAADLYRRSLLTARGSGDAAARTAEAATLVNLGNRLAREGPQRSADALACHDAGAMLAASLGQKELAVRASLNAARAATAAGDPSARRRLAAALARIEAQAGAERALHLLAAASVARDAAEAGIGGPSESALLDRAEAAAGGDLRILSRIEGRRGERRAAQGDHRGALRLHRSALLKAETADAPEIAYRWRWRIAQAHAALGQAAAAERAYLAAIDQLESVRRALPPVDGFGRPVFREAVGPVYIEYADLLMRGGRLAEARDAVETLRTAQLEDYFRDDCVRLLQSRASGAAGLSRDAAVLYPVFFEDRLELLLDFGDRLLRRAAPLPPDAIAQAARRLNALLASPRSRREEYEPVAAELYDALIAPLRGDLDAAGVRTLVFVPDGALRLVPLAALFDPERQRHLVRDFAVAVIPGMTLVAPEPLASTPIDALAAGLTGAPPGWEPLPYVPEEIDAISRLTGARTLTGAAFTPERLRRELEARSYNVLHIASHADFSGEVGRSFLVTDAGTIDLDQLEELVRLTRFRDRPIELLGLSACRTAAGDERALLGLGGVAVKSGARSALASMWLVSDRAAATLATEFYRGLVEDGLSKAEALRQAQLALRFGSATRHPFYWAGFLVIGNWL